MNDLAYYINTYNIRLNCNIKMNRFVKLTDVLHLQGIGCK